MAEVLGGSVDRVVLQPAMASPSTAESAVAVKAARWAGLV
jgi:hypothetical protein